MSETFCDGNSGGFTLPGGHGGKIAAIALTFAMNDKDVSIYGGGRFRQFRGGMIQGTFVASGFARNANANTSPGVATMEQDGASITATVDGGCTYSGTAIFTRIRLDSKVDDPAVALAYEGKFTGTITETWATS